MSTRLAVMTRLASVEKGVRTLRLRVNTSRMMKGRKMSMYSRESKLGTITAVSLVWQFHDVPFAASTT